jgi:hypothetical protein
MAILPEDSGPLIQWYLIDDFLVGILVAIVSNYTFRTMVST